MADARANTKTRGTMPAESLGKELELQIFSQKTILRLLDNNIF